MRTTIEIDDNLIRQAMRLSRVATKKAAVEEALQLLIRTRSQASMRKLRGKVHLRGGLKNSRAARMPD